MSFINKIPRGLRILIVMAVLGVLIWRFAMNTDYYWYSIGAAILLTFGAIVLVYRPFKSGKAKAAKPAKEEAQPKDQLEVELDKIDVETDYTDTPAILRNGKSQAFAANQAEPKTANESSQFKNKVNPIQSAKGKPALNKKIIDDIEAVSESDSAKEPVDNTIEPSAPPVPLVDDETTLTDDEKNQLVNAVWYRCENPYCKYTSFLGVHHIIDEKEGGTNRLDNLIVLCPYCHDLAHRNEIPEKELRDWISNRENRFKSKPNWKYF